MRKQLAAILLLFAVAGTRPTVSAQLQSGSAQVTAPAQGTRAAEPPDPAPGRLVDVGGWRLHLYCLGEAKAGQPTVILEAAR
jgi:hypothetical protein